MTAKWMCHEYFSCIWKPYKTRNKSKPLHIQNDTSMWCSMTQPYSIKCISIGFWKALISFMCIQQCGIIIFLTSVKHLQHQKKKIHRRSHSIWPFDAFTLLYNIYFDCYVSATGSSVANNEKKSDFLFCHHFHIQMKSHSTMYIDLNFLLLTKVTNLECEFN